MIAGRQLPDQGGEALLVLGSERPGTGLLEDGDLGRVNARLREDLLPPLCCHRRRWDVKVDQAHHLAAPEPASPRPLGGGPGGRGGDLLIVLSKQCLDPPQLGLPSRLEQFLDQPPYWCRWLFPAPPDPAHPPPRRRGG